MGAATLVTGETFAPSVRSSIRALRRHRAVPDFKPEVDRPRGYRVPCSFSWSCLWAALAWREESRLLHLLLCLSSQIVTRQASHDHHATSRGSGGNGGHLHGPGSAAWWLHHSPRLALWHGHQADLAAAGLRRIQVSSAQPWLPRDPYSPCCCAAGSSTSWQAAIAIAARPLYNSETTPRID